MSSVRSATLADMFYGDLRGIMKTPDRLEYHQLFAHQKKIYDACFGPPDEQPEKEAPK